MDRLPSYAIGLVHIGWALSLIFDAARYVGKPLYPPIFAILHIIVSIIIIINDVVGGVLSAGIMAYYWSAVKPLEPIAEPQSVGILFLSASLLSSLMNKWLNSRDLLLFGFRLGVAYPYLEWGIDAFRNPLHFHAYLLQNPFTSFLADLSLIREAVFLLGLTELLLALTILLGIAVKHFSSLSLLMLIIFMIVAGYPLAIPQNIALAAASLTLIKNDGGRYSIHFALKLLRALMR